MLRRRATTGREREGRTQSGRRSITAKLLRNTQIACLTPASGLGDDACHGIPEAVGTRNLASKALTNRIVGGEKIHTVAGTWGTEAATPRGMGQMARPSASLGSLEISTPKTGRDENKQEKKIRGTHRNYSREPSCPWTHVDPDQRGPCYFGLARQAVQPRDP